MVLNLFALSSPPQLPQALQLIVRVRPILHHPALRRLSGHDPRPRQNVFLVRISHLQGSDALQLAQARALQGAKSLGL